MRAALLPISFRADASLLSLLLQLKPAPAALLSMPTWVPWSLGPPRARMLVQAWALEPMEANLEQSCRISSDCLGTSVVSASNTQVEVIVLPWATSLMSKFPIPIDQVH